MSRRSRRLRAFLGVVRGDALEEFVEFSGVVRSRADDATTPGRSPSSRRIRSNSAEIRSAAPPEEAPPSFQSR
ncbi:hypothetical protein [Streptomyces chiangmaiensis]|uniref:Uncharacterized protein n=1 Tax=Streptomyces chiangmaiensis TaxID=766497 RepID=A0ABU7FNN2_9ACTN|nr:hypothetical protein [Streptomyces chiangmaiensis]MED7825702.1 hypothetical protein [Streptomyces chiangmaiensis]